MYYFVSRARGDDGNVGSYELPWGTAEKAIAEFPNLLPGDEVRFQCDDVFLPTGRLIVAGASGLAESPITLGSYGDGAKPVFDMGWNPFFFGRYADSLRADFVTVRGLEMRNVRRNCMFLARGCIGWTLDDLYLHDAIDDGGWCALLQFHYTSDMLVTGLVAERSEGEGVYIGSAPGTDPNDCVERLTMQSFIVRDCDNEGIDLKDGSTWNCLIDDGLVENCGADEGQMVSLGGTYNTMRRVTVRKPPPNLRATVRVSNYNVPEGTGHSIVLEDSFIEGQFGERDGHPCACVRMYQTLNALRNLTLANSQAGISAWAMDADPTQAIESIGFSNVAEWINYVSNRDSFSVSNLWEVNLMSVVTDLQVVEAQLRASGGALEAEAAVITAQADAVAAQIVALQLLDDQMDAAADIIEVD